MKNIIKTRCLNLLLGILILAGCSNPALEQIETSARTGTGAVSVRIGTVEGQFEDVARTLAPVAPPEFLRYTLTFSGPEEHEAVDITFGTSASLELAVGEWTITATAYTDETAVAQGSVTVTVHTGSNTPANIILTPVSGGTGTFSYSIDAPTGVTGTLVVVTAEGVAVSGSPFTLTEGPNVDNLSLSSGQYLMSVRLTLDGKAAGRTEAVHIYSDMTTSVEYRFTGHDFSEIVNLVAGEWQDGTISSGDELYYRFTAATETDYTITWDDYYGTKNDYPYVVLRVDAYWEADNTSIFTYGYGYEAPKTFNTGSNSGNIIVRVEYDGGYDSGPYAIKYYDSTSLPPQGSMTISSVVATPVPACVISWNYVNGVTGYRLYRSTNPDSGYTEIADITSYYTTSYTDTGVSAGSTYYYKVAAYNANGVGEQSSAKSGTPPDSSAITALTDGEWLGDEIATSGDIKWYSFIASEGTSYQVQWNDRYDGDGTKTLYANVSAFQADGSYIFQATNGWTQPQTVSGVTGTVYLLVQGYGSGTYAIKYYDSTSLPPQAAMTISSVVGTPVLTYVISWNYVDGVTGYKLYRSTNLDSGYTEIADITGYYTSYTDTGVSAGTTYYYKVAAYNANGEGELSSAMSGTPPDSSAIIALTDGEWLHDEIATSGDIKWYSFIASEGTSYQVQWNARFYGDGTKTLYANVSAFQADGSYIFHEIDSGWTSPETFSGVSGTVYLLVQGWSLGDTGTYAIKYAQE